MMAILLAVIPYFIFRWIVERVARRWFARKSIRSGDREDRGMSARLCHELRPPADQRIAPMTNLRRQRGEFCSNTCTRSADLQQRLGLVWAGNLNVRWSRAAVRPDRVDAAPLLAVVQSAFGGRRRRHPVTVGGRRARALSHCCAAARASRRLPARRSSTASCTISPAAASSVKLSEGHSRRSSRLDPTVADNLRGDRSDRGPAYLCGRRWRQLCRIRSISCRHRAAPVGRHAALFAVGRLVAYAGQLAAPAGPDLRLDAGRLALWARLVRLDRAARAAAGGVTPGSCAGLGFLGHSVRAFSIVAWRWR